MKNTNENCAAPRRSAIHFPDDGLTKQAQAAECNINYIMAKYVKTGLVSHLNEHGQQYGFATSLDFQEAITLVDDATAMFADLPSLVRARFMNAPERFLDFVQDPENAEEIREMGLAPKEKAPEEPRTRRSGDANATTPETQAIASKPVHKSTGSTE